jgi:5-methylcytosine-specific restriction protein A
MRNPNWHRDEIILALDLYFSPDRGSIDDKNPKIIQLSKIINNLPLFIYRPDKEKFRNANGITLKLSNFLAIDPNYKGKGMKGGSELDKQIFNEFFQNRDKLKAIAEEIKKISADDQLKHKISAIEEDDQSIIDGVIEGQILYKLHKVRERDRKIVRQKREQVLRIHGKLSCEVCSFVFEDYYGEIGKGFIECHHRTPLSSLKTSSKTTLDDLALVCCNCHRMLHKKIDTLTVDELKRLIWNQGH